MFSTTFQMSTSPQQSKTVGIVIVVVLIILLIIYGIWIYISSRNGTGFFADYTPELATGLVQSVPNDRFTPMTPEIEAKKNAMINRALEIARSKQT